MNTLCDRDLHGTCIAQSIGQTLPNKTCEMQESGISQKCHFQESTSSHIKQPMITDEQEKLIRLFVAIIACIVTSVFGVLGNVVNIVVYWKQGLKDSITLGFFALSVSDLLLVFMPLFMGILYTAKQILSDSKYDFSSMHYVSSAWAKDFLYSNSCLITAFLALERCCCIVLPFKVQSYFTRKRTAIFLSAVTIFHVAGMCLNPSIVQLRWQVEPGGKYNTSTLRVWFTEIGPQIELIFLTIVSLIVPVVAQAIVTVCALFMINGLRISSQFRASATRTNPENNFGDQSCNNTKSDVKQGGGNFSNRDARLVKTMIFLVTILTVCNIPLIGILFAWRFVPELSIGGAYQNTMSVLSTSLYVISNINASANVIVYYKVSTRFREVAREIFCIECQNKKRLHE